jgi:hypothetical protein
MARAHARTLSDDTPLASGNIQGRPAFASGKNGFEPIVAVEEIIDLRGVVATSAEHSIGCAVAGLKCIVATPCAETIGARPTGEGVISIATVDLVGGIGTNEHVVAASALPVRQDIASLLRAIWSVLAASAKLSTW